MDVICGLGDSRCNFTIPTNQCFKSILGCIKAIMLYHSENNRKLLKTKLPRKTQPSVQKWYLMTGLPVNGSAHGRSKSWTSMELDGNQANAVHLQVPFGIQREKRKEAILSGVTQ